MFLPENTFHICLLRICQPASLPQSLEFRKTSNYLYLRLPVCSLVERCNWSQNIGYVVTQSNTTMLMKKFPVTNYEIYILRRQFLLHHLFSPISNRHLAAWLAVSFPNKILTFVCCLSRLNKSHPKHSVPLR